MEEEFKNLTEDDLQWRRKEPQSYKEIVLRALENCRKEMSKDLRVGGTYETPTPKGVFPVYFPDQREVIVNNIKTFNELMIAFYDNKAKKNLGILKNQIDGAYKKYFEKYIIIEWSIPLKKRAMQTKMIQLDNLGNRARSIVGESILRELENYILEKHRRIFVQLVLLFRRKNELSGKKTSET